MSITVIVFQGNGVEKGKNRWRVDFGWLNAHFRLQSKVYSRLTLVDPVGWRGYVVVFRESPV
jgi:hypothetical protein